MPRRLGRWMTLIAGAFFLASCDPPPPPNAAPPPPTPPGPSAVIANPPSTAPVPPPVTPVTPAAPAIPAAHVKILTWNVNYGGPGMAEAVRILRAGDADLVCLQETTTEWEALLRKELADTYPYQCFQGSGGGGQGILSKTPLETVAWIEPEAPAPRAPNHATSGWFGGWIVCTQTATGRFQVLNVHLRPPCDDDGQYTWASLARGGTVHRQELARFTPKLRADLPTFVTGDFNENDGDQGMQYLQQRGFQDALAQHDPLAITWHWRLQGINLTGRYDHILHTDKFTCLAARVITKGQSDHYPVVAEFAPATK